MDTFNLPNAINSCIKHGRQLYYRLVFLLGMDPSLSIEIIAFWLLVEGNSEVDFLQRINSFHGDHFLALVATGKQFIDALHGNPVDLKSRSAREFHNQVLMGICFFLNNVCYKVLNDIRQKAEQGVAIHDMEGSTDSNYHVLHQHMKDRRHISTNYHHYQGDGSTSRSMPTAISLEDVEEYPDSKYHALHRYIKDRPHIRTNYHHYQGDGSTSKSMPTAISMEDVEESPDSNYHGLRQYMKDWPHTSSRCHQYQGDCSVSRTSMPVAIKSFEDMVRTMDEVLSMNAFSPDLCNMIPQQQKNGTMSVSSRSTMPTAIQNHQDMVKMRYGTNSMNAFSTDLATLSPQTVGTNISSDLDLHDLESLFNNFTISPQFPSEWDNTLPQSSTMNMDSYVHSIVPQDGRTLFVTFSNGYPLTKNEVYNFFMSNFGDVESLSIEEPVELRPPQYAIVIFGSLETVLLILDGREKVKFVTGGKHLWARKYVSKNKKKGKNNAWM